MTAPLPDWRASYTRAFNTAGVCGVCGLRRRRREWAEVYPGLSTTPGLLGAIVAQTLRLAAIYAALDRDSEPGEVSLPHLRAALAVVKFSRECARYIFHGKLIGDTVADRIIQQLRRRSCTRTELHDLFQGHAPAKRISEALDRLLDLGLVRCTSTPTAGRSRENWSAV